ncbi:MAG: protein of unknown function DUF4407/DUF4407 [Verrucomicrobia bacterium]|nr:MAG: protein of unknown function DUF4407/DUF4407 [Verrucomicrobiota bacterium]
MKQALSEKIESEETGVVREKAIESAAQVTHQQQERTVYASVRAPSWTDREPLVEEHQKSTRSFQIIEPQTPSFVPETRTTVAEWSDVSTSPASIPVAAPPVPVAPETTPAAETPPRTEAAKPPTAPAEGTKLFAPRDPAKTEPTNLGSAPVVDRPLTAEEEKQSLQHKKEIADEAVKLAKSELELQKAERKLNNEKLKRLRTERRLEDEQLRAHRRDEFNLGAWLAGASMEDLRHCSATERQKVCATGYTVLVPTIFSLLSASYATSTLTTNPYVIGLVAVAWAVIILLVDRAIIATYSPNMSFLGKTGTILIRFVVAGLMGITVSHPLTLLIFKDTINARIEEERAVEIATKREKFATDKKDLEAKVATAQTEVQKQQALYQQSLDANIETPTTAVAAEVAAGSLTDAEQTLLNQRIETAAKPFQKELDELEELIKTGQARRAVLQQEVDDWQKQFEAELGGTRSGKGGVGPRSNTILKTQLEPRKEEQNRLGTDLAAWTARRGELRKSISDSAESLRKQMDEVARARAEKARDENTRLASLQQQINEKKLNTLISEGDTIRKGIQRSIDSAQAELDRVRRELEELTTQELKVMNDLRTNPRRDMLSQSMALHHLFEHPELGGEVAWIAYVVLAALFLAIDTMPILVKFTAKKGEYDRFRDLNYAMADIPAEQRKASERGAEDLQRSALALNLQEQKKRFHELEEQARLSEEKALEVKARVLEKEKMAAAKEAEAIRAKADRDAALTLKNLEIEELERTRQQKVAEEGRKAAQLQRQTKLEELELAVKEAEANQAKTRAHLSELELKTAKNDPQGLLKHQLQEQQVARGRERFASLQEAEGTAVDRTDDPSLPTGESVPASSETEEI